MGRAAARTRFSSPDRAGRAAGHVVMSAAAAALRERSETESALALVEPAKPLDVVDQLAQLVVDVVALVGEPVDPALIAPAALVLRSEGLVDLPGVTFGCNYDLDVLSFELSRGFTRGIDAGSLLLRARRVSVNADMPRTAADGRKAARASELFGLDRRESMRVARHYLLRDAADRSSDTA